MHLRKVVERLVSHGSLAAALLLLPFVVWSIGALIFALSPGNTEIIAATAALLLLWVSGLFRLRALAAAAVMVIAIAVTFMMLTPDQVFRNTGWQAPWRVAPEVTRQNGGRVQIRNVRDFRYRGKNDYDLRYRELELTTAKLESADIALSHWDDMVMVAHSMLTFNFSDGESIVFSLETRLPEGTGQSALAGIYKNFGLIMLAGTPRDLYALRTVHRGESLFVYRLNFTGTALRKLYNAVIQRSIEINCTTGFYNTITRNCTTGILPFLLLTEKNIRHDDIRMLCNGFSDQMLFERGYLVSRKGESFASLRSRSLVPGKCAGTEAELRPYAGESSTVWLRTAHKYRITPE